MAGKVLKVVLAIFCSFAILAAGLFSGYLIGSCSGGGSSSYKWVMRTVKEEYYRELSDEEIYNIIMNYGVGGLDMYSEYYSKEDYEKQLSANVGNMSGVGITYSFIGENQSELGSGVYIVGTEGNSPACKSGLKEGTFVSGARYNGQVTEFDTAAAFTDFMSARATGEKFTFITDRGEYGLSKEEYRASYCSMYTAKSAYKCEYGGDGELSIIKSDGGIDVLPDGAAYLKFNRFYGNAVGEFASLIRLYNAEKCTSLILDLRGNGGGMVDVMGGISHILLGQPNLKNTISMTARYQKGNQSNFYVESGLKDTSCFLPQGAKVSVLADNGSASASEALIGVLISYGVIDYGDIYLSDFSSDYLTFTNTAEKNKKSYGKGIMQTTFENIFTGEALKLTTAQIYWPNGKSIHGVGLTESDGCNTVYTYWEAQYGDPQLAAAIELIYA